MSLFAIFHAHLLGRVYPLIQRYADTQLRTFPTDEIVPLDGVVRGLWREAVIEKDAEGRSRVNRITYEVAALEALRTKLRCKEIWVVGAHRYRNPDEDLPADFEKNCTVYHQALNLPKDADRFISNLQDEMRQAFDKPRLCFDESDKQQIEEINEKLPMRPGSIEKYDSEYKRNGASNLFMIFEPLQGKGM